MKKRIILFSLAAGLLVLLVGSCSGGAKYEYPFQDPRLDREARVENLLSLLTPEEKVGLMMNKSVSVDRLGIPSYNWWSEACHGVRQDGYTVYPQPIGMAASFDPGMVYDVFTQVSDEARANWNRSDHNVFGVGMGEIYYPGNPELTFWCPNVNIFRDPRWGRGQETPGEDPYLSAVMGVQTVKGMQGNDSKYYKTHACAKHYAVHSGPEPLRHSYDASVSMRDLWETYLPAFKALVTEANVQEVMCAYNRYEGEPCCMSDRLLVDILRNKWGYKAIVLTDCDAINNFFNPRQHGTHPDALHAGVDAILNGTDLECGKTMMSLVDGLREGLIQETDLDVHLRRTLLSRFELGMFDPQDNLPWAKLGEDVISSAEHNEMAVRAARESMVLLKNEGGALPLRASSLKKIAVLGPNADDTELLNGNYGGTPIEKYKTSLLSGIRAALPGVEVIYEKACELNDEYNTTNYLPALNDGKGMKVEFFEGGALKGNPTKTEYYKEVNFSTFGAYGFAEGVNSDKVAVRMEGEITSPFTGDMSYYLSSDSGYRLYVNGKLVEDAKAVEGARRFRFGNSALPYKTFKVEEGKTYDIKVEYVRGSGPFAMLSAQLCRREYADFSAIAKRVSDCDAVIVIGGISARMEGEGGDKADIELPHVQQRLLHAVGEAGPKVIFVNCSGSAIAFATVEKDCDAILQAWYPGQGGARALSDIILGKCNPSAKLPVTFYASTSQLPDFLDYSMEGRTYRYFRGEPLYPFGYGLSYTTFEVGEGKLSKTSLKKGETLTITVPVKNTGSVQGDEVIQVYVKALDNPTASIKDLKGFGRISLAPGKSGNLKIELGPHTFEYYDKDIDELSVMSGKYQILYGTSSADKDLKVIPVEVRG